jgi:hypothetical protein
MRGDLGVMLCYFVVVVWLWGWYEGMEAEVEGVLVLIADQRYLGFLEKRMNRSSGINQRV